MTAREIKPVERHYFNAIVRGVQPTPANLIQMMNRAGREGKIYEFTNLKIKKQKPYRSIEEPWEPAW